MRWFTAPRTLAMVLGASLCSVAFATPVIQNGFKSVCKPKPGTALARATCKGCHVAPPKLNPFGMDIKSEMTRQKTKTFTAAVWAKVGAKDSDHDGAANSKEDMLYRVLKIKDGTTDLVVYTE